MEYSSNDYFPLQAKNEDYFSQYVTEDFNNYVNRKRLEYVHGNHIEIQAMSELYNRSIEVFCYSTGNYLTKANYEFCQILFIFS